MLAPAFEDILHQKQGILDLSTHKMQNMDPVFLFSLLFVCLFCSQQNNNSFGLWSGASIWNAGVHWRQEIPCKPCIRHRASQYRNGKEILKICSSKEYLFPLLGKQEAHIFLDKYKAATMQCIQQPFLLKAEIQTDLHQSRQSFIQLLILAQTKSSQVKCVSVRNQVCFITFSIFCKEDAVLLSLTHLETFLSFFVKFVAQIFTYM